jgi:acyl carrier protein
MLPSAFVVLESIPLTPSGKLDRRSLPAPELGAFLSHEYQPPESDVERELAHIWQDLLGVARVGRNDHFFELGGHSLLAMQVIVRIRMSMGLELPISALFEQPMLKQLALYLEGRREEALFQNLSSGGDELDVLLDEVASMSESQVQELMRELRMEGRL